ncbi:GGDEF domain-containing protein [uncultured Selenomonas sp.]|uniref:GGDEF domain-containing protein n=1 Tax=uncultured Selenomonas sp. TaxID=159275 RepID=UPI0025F6B559|nr:GGDEF domain-containing protein [uncultured Selenomonas sp.]
MEDEHRPAIPSDFSREVFNMLDDLDQHLYFRWDLTADEVTLHEPLPHRFRELPVHLSHASTQFWTERLIHPEDRPILHAYLHSIFRLGGAKITERTRKASAKLRVRHHRGSYLWAEVHIITFFEDGVPIVAYGNMRSIQAEKLWQKRMQAKADRDSLTGLLRKDAAIHQMQNCIEGFLPGRDHAALLLIDADGFKAINDNFGHLFGDGVLAEMGRTIRGHFRMTDIKGRVGGDEFLVLLRNTQDIDGIQRHLGRLLTALHHNYQSGGRTLPFSISIGVSLYPEHGTSYHDLFAHADRALYEAKSRGKNQSCIYSPKFFQAAAVTNSRDPESTIDLQMKAFEDNMAEFVLQLFYETNSPEATINYAMSLLGRLYNLDRIVIARCDAKTGRYHDAFEWLGPDGGTLTGPEYTRMARERRRMILDDAHPTPYGVISICENTEDLEPRHAKTAYFFGLKAYAYGIIPHGAETMGCIGVECTHPMQIRKELLRSLNLFSVLLGNILLPQDSGLALQRRLALLTDVLNHLPVPCCVIDNTTKEIIFANERAHAQGFHDLNAPGLRKTLLHEHTKDGHELLMVVKDTVALSYL